MKNKTVAKGVMLTPSGRYEAKIGHKGKKYFLGTFDAIDEAVKAYEKAKQEFSEESTNNFFEKRVKLLAMRGAGGNSGANSLAYNTSFPTTWVKDMGVTPEDRRTMWEYDPDKKVITIRKATDDDENNG